MAIRIGKNLVFSNRALIPAEDIPELAPAVQRLAELVEKSNLFDDEKEEVSRLRNLLVIPNKHSS